METARAKARIDRQLDRLKRLFVLGDMQEQEYLLEWARLEAMAAALIPPAMPDLERAAELLSNFGTIWDAAQLRERKQIVRTLIEAVFLDCGVEGADRCGPAKGGVRASLLCGGERRRADIVSANRYDTTRGVDSGRLRPPHPVPCAGHRSHLELLIAQLRPRCANAIICHLSRQDMGS